MDKLNMKTANIADENFKKLSTMFPNAVTETITGYDEEGNAIIEHCIDKDILMQEINCKVVDGKEERYQFTWPDKRKAILAANSPISETLRPCKEESVGKDGTPGGFDSENLYIEGDNLDVLKLLQETYLGKIKMIYIDPPYNTGNDFVYEDDFSETTDEYLEKSGQFDKDGNRLVQNTESNGRFHTDWLNMMYPRMKLARNLLTEDGVICINIDDNEIENLKKIMNEIYGETNFQGNIHWRRRHNQPNDKTKMIGLVAEHILVYAKDSIYLKSAGVGKIDLTGKFTNPDNDPRGPWATKPWKVGSDQNGSRYKITTPTGKIYDEEWMGEENTFYDLLKDGRIQFPDGGNGSPRKKYYQYERQEEGQCATNWWNHEQFGHNQGANDVLTNLFGIKNVFSNPKPLELLRGLMQICNIKDKDIVLDFFSGSATMAHTVLNYNLENQIKSKFIMVQAKENLDETIQHADSKAKKQIQVSIDFLDSIKKPHLITEIGKERIRRAGAKIREENALTAGDLDAGFRVLKLDSTNMKDVYYNPEEIAQNTLDGLVDNIKGDRINEDLLFQTMLELGVPLSSKIKEEKIGGVTVFNVGEENFLIATFDSGVTDDIVKEIAKKQPYYFVVRDSSMDNDAVAANFEQIFKTYSPDTKRKVL